MRVRLPLLLVGGVLLLTVVPGACKNDNNNMTGPNATATPTSPPATATVTAPPLTATVPPATATVVRTATPTITPTPGAAAYAGTWTGPWNNLTFSTSGTGTLVDTVNTASQTFDATLTLTGNVFGSGAPPPQHFSGSYASNSFTQAGTAFGDITINFPAPGAFTGSGVNVPNPNIARIDFTGTVTTTRISLAYTITFTAAAGGGSANGTMVLNKVS
jgi:hypothetical protein